MSLALVYFDEPLQPPRTAVDALRWLREIADDLVDRVVARHEIEDASDEIETIYRAVDSLIETGECTRALVKLSCLGLSAAQLAVPTC